MKTLQTILQLLIALLIQFISSNGFAKDMELQLPTIETKTIVLQSFDKISTEFSVEVEVVKSNEEKAVIYSNYMNEIEIVVKDRTLYIGYKDSEQLQNVKTQIKVYAKGLKALHSKLGSSIYVKDTFPIENYILETGSKISSSSNADKVFIVSKEGSVFSGNLQSNDTEINAESAGKAEIRGNIKFAKLNSENASKINALKADISEAVVKAVSASEVLVSVSKQLEAYAENMAAIRYKTLAGIKFLAEREAGGSIDMY